MNFKYKMPITKCKLNIFNLSVDILKKSNYNNIKLPTNL